MAPELVIFDFDGVLADSETIALEELAAEITLRGVPLTAAEAAARFLGASTADHMRFITERTGQPCGADFPDVWHQRLYRRFATELYPVTGAVATLDHLDRLGIPYCIGSGGSVDRLARALSCIGLTKRFADRAFSAELVARGKPAPDLFLFAAERMGVAPAACLVVEDAPAGVRAALAAGMDCLGFLGGSHLTASAGDHAARLAECGARTSVASHAALRDCFGA